MTKDAAICPLCSEDLAPGKSYCPSCGARVADSDALSAVKAYVDREFSAKVKEQNGVVNEVADKAEDIVLRRYRNYGLLIAGFVAVVGYFGYMKFSDLYTSIAPKVEDVRTKVAALQGDVNTQRSRMQSLDADLTQLSQHADQEARNVAAKSGAIAGKFAELDAAAQDAAVVASNYKQRLASLSSQLGDAQASLATAQKALQQQVSQVSRQATDLSIQRAFPQLGKAIFLAFNGAPWGGGSDKKPGEKWVSISVALYAMRDFNDDFLERLSKIVQDDGGTPEPGTFTSGGPYATIDFKGQNYARSTVVYYDPANEALAKELQIELASLISSSVDLEFNDAAAISETPETEVRYLIAHGSGIDAQIFLMPRSALTR